MRFYKLLVIVGFLLVILLAACSAPPASPSRPTHTPPPPQVKTESMDQPAPTSEVAVHTQPTPTETQPPAPAAEPASTSAEETLSAPAVEPTVAPTTDAPAEQAVPAANNPPSQEGESQPSGCEDKAAFYADVTIPDDTSFAQSVDFEKIWRIRNVGTCTWDGYKLVWAGGDLFDAAVSNPIPLTSPGEIVDIGVKMHSPNKGGVYLSQWQFESSGGRRFGVNSGGIDLIWVRISVTWYPEGSTAPGLSEMPTPVGGCALTTNQGYVDQLLGLINDARQQKGLQPLALDPKLTAAAQAHSEDMACKNFADHTGSDGSSWPERIKAAGYKPGYVSENIYSGDPAFGGDAQGAFTWWMNSQVHRNNILSEKITQIGIGFASSETAQYKGRYTLNFARPAK